MFHGRARQVGRFRPIERLFQQRHSLWTEFDDRLEHVKCDGLILRSERLSKYLLESFWIGLEIAKGGDGSPGNPAILAGRRRDQGLHRFVGAVIELSQRDCRVVLNDRIAVGDQLPQVPGGTLSQCAIIAQCPRTSPLNLVVVVVKQFLQFRHYLRRRLMPLTEAVDGGVALFPFAFSGHQQLLGRFRRFGCKTLCRGESC